VIVWDHVRGRTSFTHLQRRLTAGRRVAHEAAHRPAHFVAFDLLRDTRDRVLLDQPLTRRRRRLERLLASVSPQLPICPETTDEQTARTWFTDWSVSGIEGLVVKKAEDTYRPGATGWVKVKTRRTEEMIIGGVTGSLTEPVSLLLGRLDASGVLRFLTHTLPLRRAQRRELSGLQRTVFHGCGSGHPWPCPLPAGWLGHLTDRQPLPYLPVEPTLIAEINTDVATEGHYDRPRHPTTVLRIRADLHPRDLPRV
jgi:ATP-dependent DNA ligase